MCAAVGFAVLLSGATHAYADPPVGEIEQQIDAEWNKLEPAIEQYNNVHTQLKDTQAKLATLQRRLQPLQLQVDVAMARVGDLASQYYRSGQGMMINAVLGGDSPDDFVYKLMMVNEMAHVQRGRIDVVTTARDKYAADKKKLDAVIAQLSAQDLDLAAKKKDIEGRIAGLQKLRQKVYGTSGSTGDLKPVACPVEYYGGKGGQAAAKACSLIGKPYHYGSTGPDSFDCSGLTLTAWAAAASHCPITQGHNGRSASPSPGPTCALGISSSSMAICIMSACTSAAAGWSTRPRPATSCGWRRSTAARSPATAARLE